MSNQSDSAPAWLTSDYIQKLLQDFLEDDSIHVDDLKIGSGSAVGDGYMGQIFRVEVHYSKRNAKESRSIIAKAILLKESTEELAKTFDFYAIEMKMMGTLPLLQEELLARGETERFFPFLYKLDRENKMIFMEDLKSDGYEVVDRTVSLDLDHALLVMKAVAKMHASSWLFLKKNPGRKQDYMDLVVKSKDGIMTKICEGLYSYLLKSLHLWPISEEDKRIFRDLEENIVDLFYDSLTRRESSFNAIIHGDFSIRNMMFRYKNGKLDSVKLIDFQGCHYNSIALDLHYFLFSSVETGVLLKHLDEVITTYYDTFVSLTGEIEGFTAETVRNEFMDRLQYGFFIATIFRPVFLSKNVLDLGSFVQGRESRSNAEMLENKKYIMDVVELLPIFKKHGIFK